MIEQFMKNNNVRLSDGSKWMVWDSGEWVVREQNYGQRTKVIHRTKHLDYALEAMTDEEDEPEPVAEAEPEVPEWEYEDFREFFGGGK